MMRSSDYESLVFGRLRDVDPEAIMALMNDVAVRRHLPLAKVRFGPDECERFVAGKERIWKEHGYGPWAFMLRGEFVGWGGLQPEGDDVDVGMVLHPRHWGAGPLLYSRIVEHAFERLGLDSVTALLPPSRTRVAGLERLGFREDGEVWIEDECFNRYRLNAPET